MSVHRIVARAASALALLGGLLTLPVLAAAEVLWLPISDVDLVRGSELVCVARLVAIERGAHAGTTDCGLLRVSQVLAGTTAAEGIRLDFPAPQAVEVVDGRAVRTYATTDVVFEKDQEGIWFLQRLPSGHYRAGHPARFKPLVFLGRIKKAIALSPAR